MADGEPTPPAQNLPTGQLNFITIYGDVTSSQIGAPSGDLMAATFYSGSRNDAVRSWLDDYLAALPELDEGVRVLAEQQLAQVAAEIQKPEPHPAIVAGLLRSLRTFAHNAITAAGTGTGTMGLAEVAAHWPF
ncbi:hypothetical protein [Jatrophihabitans sp.]|uniref:hypothetical protein n=1 Tax=Jatrophihabitans sp. TaxID=1932789 RepID=UPI002F0E40A0